MLEQRQRWRAKKKSEATTEASSSQLPRSNRLPCFALGLDRRLSSTTTLVVLCLASWLHLYSFHFSTTAKLKYRGFLASEQPRQIRRKSTTRKLNKIVSGSNPLWDDEELRRLCFPLNSLRWITNTRRLNNVLVHDKKPKNRILYDSGSFSRLYAQRLILSSTWTDEPWRPIGADSSYSHDQFLRSQSLCGATSSFVGETLNQMERHNNKSATANTTWSPWTPEQLVYSLLHRHQHRPALEEAQQRWDWVHGASESVEQNENDFKVNRSCGMFHRLHNIGTFNYECPKARFLVVSFDRNGGIGSNIRLIAVPAFVAGLVLNRVVLFVNNVADESGIFNVSKFLRQPWSTSCDGHDMQCNFLPSSPCSLTKDELSGAHELKRYETRHVFQHGYLPPGNNGTNEHSTDRVLVMHLKLRPQRIPPSLPMILYNLSTDWIEEDKSLNKSRASQHRNDWAPQQAAMDQLLSSQEMTPETHPNQYLYYGIGSAIFRAVALYSLRPHPWHKSKINEMVSRIRSEHPERPPHPEAYHAIGLPIRGTYTLSLTQRCSMMWLTNHWVHPPFHIFNSERQVFDGKRVLPVFPIYGSDKSHRI
jgi:hypothetical protein